MIATATRKRSILSGISALLAVLVLMLQLAIPVSAAGASDFMKVSANKSFNKDGKYWMSFNLANTARDGSTIAFSAKLVDPAGKTIATWKEKACSSSQGEKRDYGMNYSTLPSGKYTFILTGRVTYNSMSSMEHPSWNWKYTVTHKSSSKLAFKDYEKELTDQGAERHKFSLSYSNAQGKVAVLRIFDSNGTLVTLLQTKGLKNTNGSVLFKWNGYSDIGSGYKCKSGEYTVQAYFSGNKEVVEKTYNLKIL